MREEIRNWWMQGKKDIEVAEKNFKIREYYVTAFFCQQGIEKALKALLMIKTKNRIFNTHSLVELGKRAKAPNKIINHLRKLAPEYTISRYPDVTETLPYENYDVETAKLHLKRAKEVFRWIKAKIE